MVLAKTFLIVALFTATAFVRAAEYPVRPVRVIVPFTAGSVHKLNREIGNVLAQPDIRERLRRLGAEPLPMTPEAFDAFLRREFKALGGVMKAAGVKAE